MRHRFQDSKIGGCQGRFVPDFKAGRSLAVITPHTPALRPPTGRRWERGVALGNTDWGARANSFPAAGLSDLFSVFYAAASRSMQSGPRLAERTGSQMMSVKY